MPETKRVVPQPRPYEPEPPAPELLAKLLPPAPGALAVTQLTASGELEYAIVHKRTYAYDADGRCRLADEQIPLAEEAVPHDEIVPGQAPSFKALAEVIGFKTGTDVVVQGSARPPKPTPRMTVVVEIANLRQTAFVFGKRVCDYHQGKLIFTPAEPFAQMPLRYENAYGGRDLAAERALMAEVERITPREQIRKGRPALEFLTEGVHPLMYPRNRFGKGYVLENNPDAIRGRELPNLERADDLLTPERLVVPHPFAWMNQPIPAGFDILDPFSFPRSAMLGMPPTSLLKPSEAPEVTRGLAPRDFSHGNVIETPAEKITEILHPDGSRCASFGLRCPFLRGDEVLQLQGFDAAKPERAFRLPGERPEFKIDTALSGAHTLIPELHLVQFSADTRVLSLIWTARVRAARPLFPGEGQTLSQNVRIHVKRV